MGFLADNASNLFINTTTPADTFDEREYADLCTVVQETHLGGDLRPTVQGAVTGAKMTRGENWTAEGRRLLLKMGYALAYPAHLAIQSDAATPLTA